MAAKTGQVRIIGGQWRSRKLRFLAAPGLRPSPDVVRETLFNWLQNSVQGKHCLDLFAGSGAFGFEAASRGAEFVTLVESNPKVARQLTQNRILLNAENLISVNCETAEMFIQRCPDKFNLIFLDPPFNTNLLNQIFGLLADNNLLATDALVYIESPNDNAVLPIPPAWHIIRQKTRGQVQSTLIQT